MRKKTARTINNWTLNVVNNVLCLECFEINSIWTDGILTFGYIAGDWWGNYVFVLCETKATLFDCAFSLVQYFERSWAVEFKFYSLKKTQDWYFSMVSALCFAPK